MTAHEIFARILFYITIVLIGIGVGGNVDEILVFDPLWSASPPEPPIRELHPTIPEGPAVASNPGVVSPGLRHGLDAFAASQL